MLPLWAQQQMYIYINTDGEGERGSDRERSLQSNGCNWHAESYLSEYTHRTWEWHKNLIHAAGHLIQAWGWAGCCLHVPRALPTDPSRVYNRLKLHCLIDLQIRVCISKIRTRIYIDIYIYLYYRSFCISFSAAPGYITRLQICKASKNRSKEQSNVAMSAHTFVCLNI